MERRDASGTIKGAGVAVAGSKSSWQPGGATAAPHRVPKLRRGRGSRRPPWKRPNRFPREPKAKKSPDDDRAAKRSRGRNPKARTALCIAVAANADEPDNVEEEEVEPAGREEEVDDLSNWNVPTWGELIGSALSAGTMRRQPPRRLRGPARHLDEVP